MSIDIHIAVWPVLNSVPIGKLELEKEPGGKQTQPGNEKKEIGCKTLVTGRVGYFLLS